MTKPAVILVGADKGGVGKTTISRALLDYFVVHNIGRALSTRRRRRARCGGFIRTLPRWSTSARPPTK